jgi:hypothetical protein
MAGRGRGASTIPATGIVLRLRLTGCFSRGTQIGSRRLGGSGTERKTAGDGDFSSWQPFLNINRPESILIDCMQPLGEAVSF